MNEEKLGRIMAKSIAIALKGAKAKKRTTIKAESLESRRKASIEWYKANLGVTVVKQGFKVTLPIKEGSREYEAVKFSNGKTGVWTRDGTILKYAWA